MITDQGITEYLGQLKNSKGMFSKKLKAALETRSYKPSKVFITAEVSTDVQFPSNEIILTTANF